ncbi:peptidylprolyl isomerase [bacterium]|nr:peptidylprolyl isomerase [bacterium]
MPRILIILTALIALTAGIAGADDTYVRLTTDEGEILLALKSDLAPNHVANFVHLCGTGFYDRTSFHRVIPGFMIQGGDPNSKDEDRGNDGTGGPTWVDVMNAEDAAKIAEVNDLLVRRGYAGFSDQAQIRAEFNSGRHVRGTVSMARSQSVDSGGSQFFICVADVPHLDGKYTVFGQVVWGLDVVDVIVATDRDRSDNPLQPIRILKADVLAGVDGLSDEERTALEAATVVPTSLE